MALVQIGRSGNKAGNKKRNAAARAGLLAVSAATTGWMAHSASGAAVYTPIVLNTSSFNVADVVPAGAPQTDAIVSVNASMDYGTGSPASNAWFEQGYALGSSNASYGLPVHGTTFTSINDTNHTFTMPASYGNGSTPTNDALMLGYLSASGTSTPTVTQGTLSFNSSGTYSGFSILTAASNGPVGFSAIVNYVNGTSQTITGLTSPDWFGSGTAAYHTNGRVVPNTTPSSFGNIGNINPTLWQVDFTVPGDMFNPLPIASVTMSLPTGTAAGRASTFAISGVVDNAIVYTGTDPSTPGTWDTTSNNFSLGGSPVAFNSSSAVIFNDSAATPNVAVASGGVVALGVKFTNNTLNYNFTGGLVNVSTGVYMTGSAPVTFNNNLIVSTAFNASGSVTFNGYLNGSTGIFLNSALGSVTMNGLSNYTGTTQISSGTLNVGALGTMGPGPLLIGSTGNVIINNPNQTVSSLNGFGTLNLAGGAIAIGGGTYNGVITGAANITINGATTFNNSGNTLSGIITLNNSAGVLSLGNAASFGTPQYLIFNGGGLSSSAPLTVASGNPIALAYLIQPGSTAQFNGTNNMDLTGGGYLAGSVGTISVGTAGTLVTSTGGIQPYVGAPDVLVKAGAGTLYLTNAAPNSITGMNVSAGVLEFDSGALGSGIPLYLSGGTLLYAPGNIEDVSSTQILNLNSAGGTVNTGGQSVVWAGTVNGANLGSFTKIGAGTLTLQTALNDTYTLVQGGNSSSPSILAFNGASGVLTQNSTGTGLSVGEQTGDYGVLNIMNGARVSLLGGGINVADQANSNTGNDTGIINLSGTGSIITSTGPVADGKGYSASYPAFGTINQSAGTTFQLSNALQIGYYGGSVGTYTMTGGNLNASSITLAINSGSQGIFNLSGGSLNVPSIAVGSGTSTLLFNGTLLNATASGTFIGAATTSKVFGGGLLITTNNTSSGLTNNYSETIAAPLASGVSIGNDGGLTFNAGTGNLTLSGNDSYTGPTNVSNNIIFTQSGTTTLAGNITTAAGTGYLNQSGSGVTILNGTDTFAGGITITNGLLELGTSLVLNLGSSKITLTGGELGITSDAQLTALNVNNSGGGIAFDNYTSNLSYNNAGNLKIGAGVGTPATLAGNISGATTLIYQGPGTLILSGSNTYTGPTNLSGGLLSFQTNASLPVGQVNFLGGGIQFYPGVTTDLTAGGRSLYMTASGGTIDTNSNNISFANPIVNSSTGTLTKTGAGTFTLPNLVATTVYGGFTVRGGTAGAPSIFALNGATNVLNVSSGTVGVGEASGDNAIISLDNGAKLLTTGTLNVGDAVATGTGLAFNDGTLNIADTGLLGTKVSAATFHLGYANGGTNALGVVNLTAGAFVDTGSSYIGYNGTGVFNMSGGTSSLSAVYIPYNPTAVGFYNQSGGVTNETSTLTLGNSANTTGIINVTGGTYNVSSTAYVGYNGKGVINVAGGTFNSTSTMLVGYYSSQGGTINVTSGTFKSTSYFEFGYEQNATLNVSGGLASLTGTNYIGYIPTSTATAATVNVTGGTLNMSSPYIGYEVNTVFNQSAGVVNTTGSVYVGYEEYSSTINQTGGNFNSPGSVYLGYFNTGGVSTWNLTNATATVGGSLYLAGDETGVGGFVNLSSGSLLTVNSITTNGVTGYAYTAANGAFLNFNGGTLKANSSSTSFVSASVQTSIGAIGAIINTNGYSDTIAANISTGVSGGPDGGLTKNGLGVLTLSGNNSYTGPTNINAGGIIGVGSTPFGTAGNYVYINTGAAFGLSSDAGLSTLQSTYHIVFNGGGILFNNYNSSTLSLTTPITLGAAAGTPSGVFENIGGNNILTYIGPGTLYLYGTNTMSGTNISSGTLGINSDAALNHAPITFGSTGVLLFNNYSSSLVLPGGAIGLGSNGSSSLTTALPSTAVLTYAGPGQLALTQPSTTTGLTTITGGILNYSSGSLGTGNINLAGGSLAFAPGVIEDLTTTRTLTLATGGGGINTDGNNVTFNSNISGTNLGAFTKSGAGNLTLQGSLTPTYSTVTGGSSLAPSTLTFNGSGAVYSQNSASNAFVIGANTGDYAVVNISNGASVSVLGGGANGGISIADQANALSSSGSNTTTGILNLSGANSLLVSSGTVYVGKGFNPNNFSSGTVNQYGGTFNLSSSAALQIGVNNASTGVFNLNGGTVLGNAVTLGANTGSTGTFNLSGGTLKASSITGGAGTSTFNFNGGTLMPTANSTSFVSGLSAVKIQAGPAIVNTGGFNVSIGSAITTGSTNPDGGLIKQGAGTLTLSASNSFVGGTTISAGTLSVSPTGLGSGPVTLSGGTLIIGATNPNTTNGFGAFSHYNSSGSFVPTVTSSTMTLTKLNTPSASAAFWTPITINDFGSFTMSFVYNHTTGSPSGPADGITFGFQNDPRGNNALGNSGGSEGFAGAAGTGVSPSDAGYLDLYNSYTGYASNGTTYEEVYDTTLEANTGEPVTLTWNGPAKTFTTTVNTGSQTDTYTQTNVDLASLLGGTAGGSATGYLGFTGATGGNTADQSLTNLTYTNYVPTAPSVANSFTLAPSTTSGIQFQINTLNSNGSIGPVSFGSGSTLNINASGTSGVGYNVTTGAVSLSGLAVIDVANSTDGKPGVVLLGALNDSGTASALAVQDSGSVTLTAPATSLVNGTQIFVGSVSHTIPGNLTLGAAGALGTLASVDVEGGSTLTLNASQTLGTLTDSGKVYLNGNTLTVGSTNNLSGAFTGIIADGSASGSVVVAGTGTFTMAGLSTYTGPTTVNSGATLVYGANNTSGGVFNRATGALIVNGTLKIATASPQITRTDLMPSSLSIAGSVGNWSGKLDLTNNELIAPPGALGTSMMLAQLSDQVKSGYNGGAWNGTGITSSAAANDSTHLTAVGVILNSTDGGSTQLYGAGGSLGLFDGANPSATSFLVKYTYYGDVNLDGVLDGSDYSRLDSSFSSEIGGSSVSGWYNGDFNYDGVVNGSDYTLMDNAFNNQGATLGTNPLAQIAAQVSPGSGSSAVPEPTTLSLLAIGAVGLLGRRRRSR